VPAAAVPETLTARLRCRRPTPGDAAAYRALLLDPAVQRWLRPPPLRPMRPEQAEEILARDVRHWAEHGYGPWLLRDRTTDALVGRAGLSWTTATGEFAVELAWALRPDRWGTGLATEAAQAAVARARALGIDEVVAFTLPANVASRRVMEKAGLRYERDFEHVGLPHVLYRLPPPDGPPDPA